MTGRFIEPSAERRRHGTIVRSSTTINDSQGGIGLPWRAYDTVERMAVQGTITSTMLQAGQHFHDLFRKAGLDGLYSADPRRIPVASSAGSRSWSKGMSNDAARLVVESSLDAIGGINSPGGSCAWHVLGCETPLKEWARTYRWGGGFLNAKTAAGILIVDLSIFELHFGFKRS